MVTLHYSMFTKLRLHQTISRGTFQNRHCVKSVRIRSFSGPYFSAFGLNTERYGVSLCTQSKCGKDGPEKLRIGALFT